MATILTDSQKKKLVMSHEKGTPASELAKKYGVSVRSVAAYVANAHR